jgi:peptidoglycan hydrolase-like protein with peptidoglycan-binding domain
MSEKKRAVEIVRDEKAPVVPVSQTKADFLALLAAYKIKNPVKYAIKEASGEFAAKLAKIVAVLVAVVLVSASVADAKMLSVGSTGFEVASLQSFLIDNGFPIPLIQNGQADRGYFGTQTRDAVMMYQEDKGVTGTGYIDSNGYGGVKLGSISSPDIMSPYFSVGGVQQWFARGDLKTATTTPCAIQSPVSTSTLLFATLQINTGTSTATTWTLASSTSAYATTTLGATYSVGSGAKATLSFNGTAGSQQDTQMLAPNTWIVWGVAGTAVRGTSYLLGTCQAGFRVIQ